LWGGCLAGRGAPPHTAYYIPCAAAPRERGRQSSVVRGLREYIPRKPLLLLYES
jgi:hypothetical protein